MLFSKLYLATTFLAGAFAAPLPNDENINGLTYRVFAYSIGKDAKRDSAISTDRNLARAADIALAKREEAGAEYSILLYSIGKEENRELSVIDKRAGATTDGATYSIIAYSIGKEEKRGDAVPEQVYARVVADAVSNKRSEDSAEYSILLYSIGKEERDVKEKRDEYSALVYSIGKEGEVEEK
ncbi:hypothetical protein GL218_08351 [Daldinia childiae]|uniref:uncharacterized protein n=1 Tax=Daldinia childiae TaxID=326645 RepID=UPI0014485FA8|nr:uncharacterized protein GL218_08351 [Daldinia childiae]KAF3068436.1 hypothetical protein GL218_08351 [Daldinia childiae]